MNRERAKELLPIIQAFAEGKEVQCRNPEGRVTSNWFDDDEMSHFELYEYRIKPEPFECWAVLWKGGCLAEASLHRTEAEAQEDIASDACEGRTFKVREVTE